MLYCKYQWLFMEPLKWLFSEPQHNQKSWSSFALILLSLFCWWKWCPSNGFPWSIYLNDGFSKTEYLDPCNIWPLLRFDAANIRESGLHAWLWLPFRMFSSTYVCPNNQHFTEKCPLPLLTCIPMIKGINWGCRSTLNCRCF